MLRKIFGPLALTILLSGLSISGAAAKVTTGQTFDDWTGRCELMREGGPEVCFVAQRQVVEGGSQLIDIALGPLGEGGKLAFMMTLPLGISIPAGVAIQIGSTPPQIPGVLLRCIPRGCIGTVPVDNALLNRITRAEFLLVGVLNAGNGETLSIRVSLKGMTAAVRALQTP